MKIKKFLDIIGMSEYEEEVIDANQVEIKPITQSKKEDLEKQKMKEKKVEKIKDNNKKVVNIFGSTQKKEDRGGSELSTVSIVRPKTFEDARLISDSIKDRSVVTFSLEHLTIEVGQRVIDFVSGTSYAMEAQLSKVTDKVFTVVPSGIAYEDLDMND